VTRATVLVALGFLSPFFLPSLVAAGPVQVERTLYLMGTRATLLVEAPDRASALRQLDRIVRSVERTEATLSTWREDSELSRLNRHPVGQPFELGAEVCALWPALIRWQQATDGAFDPAVGALIEAWGLRGRGRRPSPEQLRAALSVTGFAQLAFDPEPGACRVTRMADVTVDAGAFGKGEALRRLQMDIGRDVAWRVDLGGQIAVSLAARGWPVAIGHPVERQKRVIEIVLDGGSIATSGASERAFAVEGGLIAHILDPRTGEALYRPEAVTVWHQDPLVADILSTALYVMAPAAALHFAESHGLAVVLQAPSEEAAVVDPTARATTEFARRFSALGVGRPSVGSRDRLQTPRP
jgi:thiamine biosynthesis lipoprotein